MGQRHNKNCRGCEVEACGQFAPWGLCPRPAEREWDWKIPAPWECSERRCVAWSQQWNWTGSNSFSKCLKGVERFLWGLPPSRFKITLASWALGVSRCCCSLHGLPGHRSYAGILWVRAQKHAFLLLYNYIFLQRLFTVDSHREVNNWPSLFL